MAEPGDDLNNTTKILLKEREKNWLKSQ